MMSGFDECISSPSHKLEFAFLIQTKIFFICSLTKMEPSYAHFANITDLIFAFIIHLSAILRHLNKIALINSIQGITN